MKIPSCAWRALAVSVPVAVLLSCGGGGDPAPSCDPTGGGGKAGSYHIKLRPQTALTSDQQLAFEAAAARIEEIVTSSPSSVPVTWTADARKNCEYPNDLPSSGSETIDGLDIFVSVKDLGSGIIAQSGPCILRSASHLPAAAVLEFDSFYLSDMSTLEIQKTVLHEMIHTLGFGTMWGPTTSDGFGWDLLYREGKTGAAFRGFQALCGSKAENGAPASWKTVPVEDCAVKPTPESSCGGGTQDSHWRWDVFHDSNTYELMTGWIDDAAAEQPISETTVASLMDIGYKVDLSKADAFTIPSSSSLRALQEAPTRGFFIGDDVRRVPPLEIPEP